MWSSLWPILAAILFFGVIIMTHELGHFTFAKIFKVKVNEFSIGMGPTLFKKRKGDTQYSLRLLPIGGFVAMEGENEESDDANSFNSKPAWQKAIIIIAGAMVNLITGILIMAVILGSAELIGTPEISKMEKNGSSVSQGLKVGDRIRYVNGHRIVTSYDLSFFMGNDKDGVVDFVVERNNELVSLKRVKFDTFESEGHTFIKYDFNILGLEPTAGRVLKYAVLDSGSIARIVVTSLKDLATMQFAIEDMSGPVGTVDIIADSASDAVTHRDPTALLTILAMIAINVGVFNLLPFPALDGGRFVFIIFEGITGRKVPDEFQALVNSIGIALLLGLMVLVTFSDIHKLF
ncbi:MAG: site-2 protease family protein [Clostridia bacterium]|nr:site-2 protease family protein [Clostridia bacterium]